MCWGQVGGGFYTNMEDRKTWSFRSLSAPRRCSSCHKMVYFTASRCKQCGNITHESCANHDNHWCHADMSTMRRHSHEPSIISGGDVTVKWHHSSFDHTRTSCPQSDRAVSLDKTDEKDASCEKSGTTTAMSGLLKVMHWLSQRRRSREFIKANAADKHVKSRFGLHHDKLDDKVARKRLKALLKNAQKRHTCALANTATAGQCYCGWTQGGVTNIYQKHPSLTTSQNFIVSPSSSLSSSGCISTVSSAAQTPSDTEGDYRSVYHTYDRLHQCMDVQTKENLIRSHLQVLGNQTVGNTSQPPSVSKLKFLSTHGQFGRQWLTKAKTLSLETKTSPTDSLCATWPPVGKSGTSVEFIDETESGIGDCDQFEDSNRSQCPDVRDTLGEWCIPFGDLEFKERLRHGRHVDIHKGRWHGEVLIYTFHQYQEEVKQFLDDVALLSMIRHENIVLFMGTCVDPPRLAIITSMRKGPSLYEHIHLKRHRLPYHTKINIARQIAQGMGYLHAKGIVHKKLNSKNIILESRVKLCIMDQGMASQEYDRFDYGCIPRGHLSYISPELLQTLQVSAPRVYPLSPYTQESDIYAFGSVLFELISEKYAYHDQSPHALIWQVGSGHRQQTDDLKCTTVFRALLMDCWSQNPKHRPPFSQALQQLQENVSLHKRHSSSEPERLHHTGLSINRGLCA